MKSTVSAVCTATDQPFQAIGAGIPEIPLPAVESQWGQGSIALPVFSVKRTVRRFLFKSLLTTRARRLTPRILKSLDDCNSLLDLGCGDMILTEFLKRNSSLAVTAVDTVDSNLSRLPLTIYNGDTLPFPDKSFDASMVAYVLHHCSDIAAVLSELKRVTARKIIIMEEVYESRFAERVLHLHDTGNRFLSTKMSIPRNFLRNNEWLGMFRKLGLTVEQSTRIYQYPLVNLTRQVYFELSVPRSSSR